MSTTLKMKHLRAATGHVLLFRQHDALSNLVHGARPLLNLIH